LLLWWQFIVLVNLSLGPVDRVEVGEKLFRHHLCQNRLILQNVPTYVLLQRCSLVDAVFGLVFVVVDHLSIEPSP
jgi:hypothetical protein